MVRIGLVQASACREVRENVERNIELAREALAEGARIVCFQELFCAPYFPQYHGVNAAPYAQKIPGPITGEFSRLAREGNAVFVLPLLEDGGEGKLYNSAVIVRQDGSLGQVYRKVHVPCDPLYYEKEYFAPGSDYVVEETPLGKIAVLICYDQWFPEAARAVALRGADIIFYPTALGTIRGMENPLEGDWREAWETVQRGHAIANGIHVAAVNRVGREGDICFFGSSFACDAFGNVLARAGEGEEALVVDVDFSMNALVREGWGFLGNRRPETYGSLVRQVSNFPGTLPAEAGYRMPAEWEPHQGVWLSWPFDNGTFPDLKSVERAYVEIVRALSGKERVYLLVRDTGMEERVSDLLARAGTGARSVRFLVYPYADVWFRDYGPTFLVHENRPSVAMVNWTFNAWGRKYPELECDDAVPAFLGGVLGIPSFSPGIVLEGGSIDTDGRGTLLTTEQCLLNPNRNPTLSRAEIEGKLAGFLGVSRFIWLRGGIAGDDTDGHVDDVARFVDPRTVVCALEEDPGEENYAVLQENYSILKGARAYDGSPLRVVPLPMPRLHGETLPASYTNFYVGNGVVLVPTFNDPADRRALEILKGLFPGRNVTGIDCSAMIEGMGAIHCVTQQFPSP
ncbi:MAG: agmatine deiminase family protein [Methanolinea sp.]